MKNKMGRRMTGSSARGTCLTLLALVLAATFTAPAFAFQFGSGDLSGSLDTTLSYGVSLRLDDQDLAIIGRDSLPNSTGLSYNGDDGNLNYDKGDLISNAVKITSDLALQYNSFGLFLRGTAFYDFENNDGDRVRTELTDEAMDMVGTDVELLDAYITYDFNVANMPAQIRVGDQVVSWGESTFIQNSINAINPIDVSKYRVPGAELKEALIPVGLVSASISPTDNISFEAFYQYKWEETRIDPPGTYWSTNDFAGEGGGKPGTGVTIGFTNYPELYPVVTIGRADSTDLATIGRDSTDADDDGQYGLAMRVYAPNLNDTEFGFYFMNYHSRVPIISAISTTPQPVINPKSVPYQMSRFSTGRYFTEYPEDIKLYGISFNTLLSGTGIALQGEISHRQDMPLQVDDVELLYSSISPTVSPELYAGVYAKAIDAGAPAGMAAGMAAGAQALYKQNLQTGFYDSGEYVAGYREMDVSQIQMTATKVFGPMFGADQFVMLGEFGLTYVHDMPDKDELRFESAGTALSGNTIIGMSAANGGLVGAHGGVGDDTIEPADAFADQTSWGYRIITKMDFNNAIGAVTLSPRIAWKHDVDGNSPGPGGNFLEDRKAVTLGLGANYLNQWTADLSYTDFFGAGRYNLINDRDFVAFNLKYSF